MRGYSNAYAQYSAPGSTSTRFVIHWPKIALFDACTSKRAEGIVVAHRGTNQPMAPNCSPTIPESNMTDQGHSSPAMRLLRAVSLVVIFIVAGAGAPSDSAAAEGACATFLSCASQSACLAPVGNSCTSCPSGEVMCGDHSSCGGLHPYAVYCVTVIEG